MSDEVREYLAQAQEEIKNLKAKIGEANSAALKCLSERNVLQECVGTANVEIERLRAALAPDAVRALLAEAEALRDLYRCDHECAECGANLLASNVPPLCFDCSACEEVEEAWSQRRTDALARLDESKKVTP